MARYFALAFAIFCAAATPAGAQATLHVGEKVKSLEGSPAIACTTQDDLKTYKSAGMGCAMGDAASCTTATNLEKQKICGPRDKYFTVVSIDESSSLVQISPLKHRSVTYWAGLESFTAAK